VCSFGLHWAHSGALMQMREQLVAENRQKFQKVAKVQERLTLGTNIWWAGCYVLFRVFHLSPGSSALYDHLLVILSTNSQVINSCDGYAFTSASTRPRKIFDPYYSKALPCGY
jgi:hypothetical protein